MSKQQLEAFYKKIAEDPALKEKVIGIKGDPATTYEKVSEIARDLGYDVEKQDFIDIFSDSEITNDELQGMVSDSNCGGNPDCTSVCTDVCGSFLGHYIGKQ